MSLKIGVYVQLYKGGGGMQNISSLGEIILKPYNEKGGYYFMFLSTGHKLHSFIWTELPITKYVIARVEELGEKDEQQLMKNVPIFERSL